VAPFIVFALPRSRTAWLSVFLARPGKPVGHDIGAQCSDPDDFIHQLSALGGSCETGAAFAWRLIRERLPECRFAVALRDPREVADSLERQGLGDHRAEMWRRWSHLQEIAAEPGVLTVQFDKLTEPECGALYRHCTGEDVPAGWWTQLDPLNIQVDLPRWVARLQQNRSQIEALKAAAVQEMARA